jgi:transposase InsO family protein
MRRKGNCWDNASTERFFRSLKHGQLTLKSLGLKASTKLSIIDLWPFTNGRRSHSNTVINPRCNLSGIFIGRLSKEVSGFCWPLQILHVGQLRGRFF